MKKALLTLSVFLGAYSAVNAQITVNLSAFRPGDQNTDTLPASGIVPGNSGASQTYDFSTLNDDLWDANTFIAPSAGILGTEYPMSNVCSSGNDFDSYYDSSSTSLILWGVAGDLLLNGVDNAHIFSNPQTVITFPSTFNDTFTDTAEFDNTFEYNDYYMGYFVDSVREKEYIITTSLIDGWGNVTTPVQTFPCLRQNILKESVDSTWAKVVVGNVHYWLNLSGDATSTQSYSYISEVGPIVTLEYYADSNAIAQATWNPTQWTSVAQMEAKNNIHVYPNPSLGEFDMTMNSTEVNDYIIEMSTVLGQVIYHESLNSFSGKYNKHFDVKNYGEGFYMLKVYNKSGLVKSDKIVIIK